MTIPNRSFVVEKVAIYQDGEFIGYRTYEQGVEWVRRTDDEPAVPDYEGVV